MQDMLKEHSSHPPPVVPQATCSPPQSDDLSASQEAPSDAQAHSGVLIGWVLRGGVILSASIILIGMLLLPLRPGGLSAHRMFIFPHTLPQEWTGLLTLHPQAVIVLGLLLLIATPVFTVATAAVAFARERDRPFVIISLIVLALLLISFFLGIGKGG
jgi:uncharacterized membrane protein